MIIVLIAVSRAVLYFLNIIIMMKKKHFHFLGTILYYTDHPYGTKIGRFWDTDNIHCQLLGMCLGDVKKCHPQLW